MRSIPRCHGRFPFEPMDAAKSNPDEVFNDALRKARLGDLEGAAARLHRVIELEGESAEVCRLLGKVDLHAGRLEEAAQWWRRALELSPADAGSARCLRVAGRYRRFRRIAAIAIVAVLIVAAGFFLWHQRESSGETQAAIARLEGHLIRIEDLVRPVAETFPKEEPPARPAIAEPAPAPVMPIEVRYKDALDSALNGDLQAARARFETLLSEAGTGNPLQANIHFWLGR
ncbi:MAG: tetratricopeptide repeat protein, partial [Acidobacteria bacterium]|nr:tetratricopeptide repeat protein [Acidobacteriota bacterium]